MVALPALVSGLDAELVRLGYKDSTMVWYRGFELSNFLRQMADHALVQAGTVAVVFAIHFAEIV